MSNLLIVTEGITDIPFFKCLTTRLGLSDCSVEERGGKDGKLLDLFLLERLADFYSNGIRKILVMRDCDGKGEKAATDSMKSSIARARRQNQTIAEILDLMNIDFLVIPTDMESLLLKTLKYPQLKDCIEQFLECVKSKGLTDIPKKENKTRFLAYLAAMKKPTDKINEDFVYEQFIDLDHTELDFIKHKINGLVNAT